MRFSVVIWALLAHFSVFVFAAPTQVLRARGNRKFSAPIHEAGKPKVKRAGDSSSAPSPLRVNRPEMSEPIMHEKLWTEQHLPKKPEEWNILYEDRVSRGEISGQLPYPQGYTGGGSHPVWAESRFSTERDGPPTVPDISSAGPDGSSTELARAPTEPDKSETKSDKVSATTNKTPAKVRIVLRGIAPSKPPSVKPEAMQTEVMQTEPMRMDAIPQAYQVASTIPPKYKPSVRLSEMTEQELAESFKRLSIAPVAEDASKAPVRSQEALGKGDGVNFVRRGVAPSKPPGEVRYIEDPDSISESTEAAASENSEYIVLAPSAKSESVGPAASDKSESPEPAASAKFESTEPAAEDKNEPESLTDFDAWYRTSWHDGKSQPILAPGTHEPDFEHWSKDVWGPSNPVLDPLLPELDIEHWSKERVAPEPHEIDFARLPEKAGASSSSKLAAEDKEVTEVPLLENPTGQKLQDRPVGAEELEKSRESPVAQKKR